MDFAREPAKLEDQDRNLAGTLRIEFMSRAITKTGKRLRPKTAVKGKRYLCATCHTRSPKPVLAPAPWYCPHCVKDKQPRNEYLEAQLDA